MLECPSTSSWRQRGRGASHGDPRRGGAVGGEAAVWRAVDRAGAGLDSGCGAAGFFFFQAEDGIRDVAVTGVQTCALPISINRALVDSMDRLTTRKNQLSIVHQTGERDYDAVRTAYARREILAEVVPFIMNMPERFGWADIIVCRAGAITAAEVAAAGRAGIFIPFGRATDSHQLRNAQEMARTGAGRLITEPELTAEKLTAEIFSLLDQPQDIEKLSSNARALARPHATEEIVNLIEEAANVQGKG